MDAMKPQAGSGAGGAPAAPIASPRRGSARV